MEKCRLQYTQSIISPLFAVLKAVHKSQYMKTTHTQEGVARSWSEYMRLSIIHHLRKRKLCHLQQRGSAKRDLLFFFKKKKARQRMKKTRSRYMWDIDIHH